MDLVGRFAQDQTDAGVLVWQAKLLVESGTVEPGLARMLRFEFDASARSAFADGSGLNDANESPPTA